MLIACWSCKGGSGTTVIAASLACMLSRADSNGALIVDLGGDVSSALGSAEPDGPGIAEWLRAGHEVPVDGLWRIEHALRPGLGLLARGEGTLGHVPRAEVLAAMLSAERRPVVVDCGRLDPHAQAPEAAIGAVFASAATHSLLVVRPCYLALRRAVAVPFRPSGVVVVCEPGRALDPDAIEDVLDVPVVARVPHDAAVSRAVDAGLLGARLPATLSRALRRAA
jgi:hypothetical protein